MKARLLSCKLNNGVQASIGVPNVPGFSWRIIPVDSNFVAGGAGARTRVGAEWTWSSTRSVLETVPAICTLYCDSHVRTHLSYEPFSDK